MPVVSLIHSGAGRSLSERMGSIHFATAEKSSTTLWIHAASVGEVQAAGPLIRELLAGRESFNIILTTMTEYGRKVAKAQLPADIPCILAPLDVPCTVRRFIGKVNPDMYIGLETELWPALLTELRRAGVPCVLLNGRMSDGSFKRYRLIRGLLSELVRTFSAVSVIQDSDREHFAFFGIPENLIQVNGNIKYDFPAADRDGVRKEYRTLLGLNGEKLFICGSTRSGEEKILAGVFLQLRRLGGRDLIWMIAPRHLERLAEVKKILAGNGLSYHLLTELKDGRRKREYPVVLVDTMGELADMYSAGDYIFCGGSLVARGGHNVMEAARWGKPVFFGPDMKDFRDAAQLLERGGAGFRATDGEQLVQLILRHMEDETVYQRACSNALEVVKLQQGAARRQAAMVKKLLAERTALRDKESFEFHESINRA
ncbi:MAG: glycosyltransferase N-terminal domain-containing protein [Desulfobulbaceae bacterium]|nr:glycosyltransferase N-terminal domain-containing protein [Desulfobulbaceae bacterium]